MRKLPFLFLFTLLLTQTVLGDSIIKEYKGVFIGTERTEVHAKLGSPKKEYTGEDEFEVSANEGVRVFYDDAKKVKAIVVTYSGKIDTAPKPRDVVGEPVEPRPDGGMYKMVRVEDKGFWVSYVKIAGENPSIIITVQSMPKGS